MHPNHLALFSDIWFYQLKIRHDRITFPPPGWCLMFSVEPILDLMFFRSGRGATGAIGVRDLNEPGDLGGVRTTATFFTCCPGVEDRLAGLLQPLRSGVLGESADDEKQKTIYFPPFLLFWLFNYPKVKSFFCLSSLSLKFYGIYRSFHGILCTVFII